MVGLSIFALCADVDRGRLMADRLPALHANDSAEIPPAEDRVSDAFRDRRARPLPTGKPVHPASDELMRRVERRQRRFSCRLYTSIGAFRSSIAFDQV